MANLCIVNAPIKNIITKPNINDLPDEEILFNQIKKTLKIAWRINISKERINEWLNNFNGDVYDIDYERRIALLLLTNFVYYIGFYIFS